MTVAQRKIINDIQNRTKNIVDDTLKLYKIIQKQKKEMTELKVSLQLEEQLRIAHQKRHAEEKHRRNILQMKYDKLVSFSCNTKTSTQPCTKNKQP